MDEDEDNEIYEVETILNSRKYAGVVKYRIRWKGYDELGDTWEEFERLDNYPEKLKEYRKKFPNKPRDERDVGGSDLPRVKRLRNTWYLLSSLLVAFSPWVFWQEDRFLMAMACMYRVHQSCGTPDTGDCGYLNKVLVPSYRSYLSCC